MQDNRKFLTGQDLLDDSFPNSIPIPGTNTRFKISGYAKLDAIQDFDYVGDRFEFELASIPVEGTPEAALDGRTTFHAKETRVGIDFRSKAHNKKREPGLPTSGRRGDRLLRRSGGLFAPTPSATCLWSRRKAAGGSDLDHLDRPGGSCRDHRLLRRGRSLWRQGGSGPMAGPRQRYPAVGRGTRGSEEQYRQPPGLRWRGSFLAAEPGLEAAMDEREGVAPPSGGGTYSKLDWQGGETGPSDRGAGFGLNVTGRLLVGKNKHNALMGGGSIGSGSAHRVVTLEGAGNDAVITPTTGLDLMSHWQAYIGFSHYWTDSLNSTITTAWTELDNADLQPDDAIHRAGSFHLNLIWFPYRLASTGIEIMWGQRTNKDLAQGEAWRFQYMAKYKFN